MTAVRVLADNPGPMTLQGTNTWVLAAPGGASVVIDPGPSSAAHLQAVAAEAGAAGRPVAGLYVTHHHLDHAEGLEGLRALTGAPVRAVQEGDCVRVDGLRLEVLATPGHTADSVCFLEAATGVLYTGDTLLGQGTTVVAHPDGRLADYLASLVRLAGLDVRTIRPGHGPEVADAPAWIAYYQEHRRQRLEQVRAAIAAGARDVPAVVAAVYAEVDRALWPAAALSVAAQWDYLREAGEVRP